DPLARVGLEVAGRHRCFLVALDLFDGHLVTSRNLCISSSDTHIACSRAQHVRVEFSAVAVVTSTPAR
ncbi:MAG: hypothetical protein ACR2ML_08230, partial [Solirubrobacteraceae bacterium]